MSGEISKAIVSIEVDYSGLTAGIDRANEMLMNRLKDRVINIRLNRQSLQEMRNQLRELNLDARVVIRAEVDKATLDRQVSEANRAIRDSIKNIEVGVKLRQTSIESLRERLNKLNFAVRVTTTLSVPSDSINAVRERIQNTNFQAKVQVNATLPADSKKSVEEQLAKTPVFATATLKTTRESRKKFQQQLDAYDFRVKVNLKIVEVDAKTVAGTVTKRVQEATGTEPAKVGPGSSQAGLIRRLEVDREAFKDRVQNDVLVQQFDLETNQAIAKIQEIEEQVNDIDKIPLEGDLKNIIRELDRIKRRSDTLFDRIDDTDVISRLESDFKQFQNTASNPALVSQMRQLTTEATNYAQAVRSASTTTEIQGYRAKFNEVVKLMEATRRLQQEETKRDRRVQDRQNELDSRVRNFAVANPAQATPFRLAADDAKTAVADFENAKTDADRVTAKARLDAALAEMRQIEALAKDATRRAERVQARQNELEARVRNFSPANRRQAQDFRESAERAKQAVSSLDSAKTDQERVRALSVLETEEAVMKKLARQADEARKKLRSLKDSIQGVEEAYESASRKSANRPILPDLRKQREAMIAALKDIDRATNRADRTKAVADFENARSEFRRLSAEAGAFSRDLDRQLDATERRFQRFVNEFRNPDLTGELSREVNEVKRLISTLRTTTDRGMRIKLQADVDSAMQRIRAVENRANSLARRKFFVSFAGGVLQDALVGIGGQLGGAPGGVITGGVSRLISSTVSGGSGIGAGAAAAGLGVGALALGGVAGTALAVRGASQVGRDGLVGNAAIERYRVSLLILTRDQEAANRIIREMEQLDVDLPVDLAPLAESAQKLVGAGFDTGRIKELVAIIADAGSVSVDGTAEGINRLTRALTQIKSKANIEQEDLNQIAELGIPINQIIAEQFGLGRGELNKSIKRGELTVDEAIEGIVAGLRRRFSGALTEQSATLEGRFTQLGDVYRQFAREVTKPAIPGVLEGLEDLIEIFRGGELQELRELFATGFGSLGVTFSIGTESLKQFLQFLDSIAESLNDILDLTAQIRENPLGVADSVTSAATTTNLGSSALSVAFANPASIGKEVGQAIAEAFVQGIRNPIERAERERQERTLAPVIADVVKNLGGAEASRLGPAAVNNRVADAVLANLENLSGGVRQEFFDQLGLQDADPASLRKQLVGILNRLPATSRATRDQVLSEDQIREAQSAERENAIARIGRLDLSELFDVGRLDASALTEELSDESVAVFESLLSSITERIANERANVQQAVADYMANVEMELQAGLLELSGEEIRRYIRDNLRRNVGELDFSLATAQEQNRNLGFDVRDFLVSIGEVGGGDFTRRANDANEFIRRQQEEARNARARFGFSLIESGRATPAEAFDERVQSRALAEDKVIQNQIFADLERQRASGFLRQQADALERAGETDLADRVRRGEVDLQIRTDERGNAKVIAAQLKLGEQIQKNFRTQTVSFDGLNQALQQRLETAREEEFRKAQLKKAEEQQKTLLLQLQALLGIKSDLQNLDTTATAAP